MPQGEPRLIGSGLAVVELRKPTKSITQVELEARAKGLSYGKYLAGYRLDRELEEAAARRQEELLAMAEEQWRQSRRRLGKHGGRPGRPVQLLDPETGRAVFTYPSVKIAAKLVGCSMPNISTQAGQYAKRKAAGKPCRWRYADEA